MSGERRISKRKINFSILLFIILLILISDQLTKFIVQNIIPLNNSIPIIKNVFYLTLVFNKGAAFGIFKNQTLFFIIIGIIATLIIIFYLPRLKTREFLVSVGLAVLLGGILGNLIDRLRFGYVIDFLDFRIWPAFNIADSAITIGAILICLQLLKRKT